MSLRVIIVEQRVRPNGLVVLKKFTFKIYIKYFSLYFSHLYEYVNL